MNKDLKNLLNDLSNNKKISKEDLLIKIQFFQHERLIHLLVTIFTGISTILFLLGALSLQNIYLFLLSIITLLLFIPYIFYYYSLENNLQELYKYYFK